MVAALRARLRCAVVAGVLLVALSAGCVATRAIPADWPFLIVLGSAQDAGAPQAGSYAHPGWTDPRKRRLVSCLALVDPRSGRRWMFDATPDFRLQLYELERVAPRGDGPVLDGVFLTHSHIGHYTGLMFLGHESIGASGVAVYAMPRMLAFLESNGPWEQLVRYENIVLRPLRAEKPIELAADLRVTPLLVPHRQEYSEVVGYRIEGPRRSAVFIPDIDSWREWDEQGVRIEDVIRSVDIAYLDGTFFANGEIPGRDMSGFPHPFISHSLERFAALPQRDRAKVRFIHLNHSNPAQFRGSAAAEAVRRAGMSIAREGQVEGL